MMTRIYFLLWILSSQALADSVTHDAFCIERTEPTAMVACHLGSQFRLDILMPTKQGEQKVSVTMLSDFSQPYRLTTLYHASQQYSIVRGSEMLGPIKRRKRAFAELLQKRRAADAAVRANAFVNGPSLTNSTVPDDCIWYHSKNPARTDQSLVDLTTPIEDVCIGSYEAPLVKGFLQLADQLRTFHEQSFPLTFEGVPIPDLMSQHYRADGYLESGKLPKMTLSGSSAHPILVRFRYFIRQTDDGFFAVPNIFKKIGQQSTPR